MLNLFLTSIESIYFCHRRWTAADNTPRFILLVQDLECCLLACISALLFVFSTRVDESTDWQSDRSLDDSAKPWPGWRFNYSQKEQERERNTGGVCVGGEREEDIERETK